MARKRASIAVADGAGGPVGEDFNGSESDGEGPEVDTSFEAADVFQGPRDGWAFKCGDRGLGYYRDAPPKVPHEIFNLVRADSCGEALERLRAEPDLWAETDEDGASLLHWAALLGNVRMVREALAAGQTVDTRKPNGQTPLMWATTRGHLNTAKTLIEGRADLHAKDSLGATPSMIAIQHMQSTHLLLFLSRANRARLLAERDYIGCGLLHWAAYKGELTCLKILDHVGADFTVVDSEQKTPLHRAVAAVEKDVLEFLLDKGIDPLFKDKDGVSCVDMVECIKHPKMHRDIKKLFKSRLEPGDGDLGGLEAGLGPRRRDEGKSKHQMDVEKYRKWGAPVFWLACVSLSVFQYLVELRVLGWTVVPWAALAFELGVPLSIGLFFYTNQCDPGKVPPRQQQQAIEELMRALEGGPGGLEEVPAPRLCPTTWVLKGPRTKYCKVTGACVEEFDHFCGWLNVAIGKGNHRPFMVLALTEVCTQLTFIYLCVKVALALEPYPGNSGRWTVQVMGSHPLLFVLLSLHICTVMGVFSLLFFQLSLVGYNMTANEYLNAQRYGLAEVTTGPRGRRMQWKANPYDKGSTARNCADFWWWRRRSQCGPASTARASSR